MIFEKDRPVRKLLAICVIKRKGHKTL
jgi:hypothetical protein